MKNKIYKFSFLLMALGTLFISCDSARVFEKNIDLPDYSWDTKNKISFEVTIDDTIPQNNFFINVRHASQYPYANLNVFVTIKFPNGKLAQDTVNCILADVNGKWLGDGMGDIWDFQSVWKHNIKFPITGKYIFEIEHAMRMDQVPFVMDMGLRIEKVEKK